LDQPPRLNNSLTNFLESTISLTDNVTKKIFFAKIKEGVDYKAILPSIFHWLRLSEEKGKIRAAIFSLQCLTNVTNKVKKGWLHNQMIHYKAIEALVEAMNCHRDSLANDVNLAAEEIMVASLHHEAPKHLPVVDGEYCEVLIKSLPELTRENRNKFLGDLVKICDSAAGYSTSLLRQKYAELIP